MTPTTPDCNPLVNKSVSWEKLDSFLKRHFTPQDAEKVSTEFKKVSLNDKYKRWLNVDMLESVY